MKRILISYMHIPKGTIGAISKEFEITIEEKNVLLRIIDLRERGFAINHGTETEFILPSAILGAEVEMTWEHLK